MNTLVEKISKSCSGIFPNEIYFTKIQNSFFLQGASPAINNHNGNKELINVLHWFENFFIYITINFLEQPIESKFFKGFDKSFYFTSLRDNYLNIDSAFFNVIVSISVFQGGFEYNEKKQLFRAEWDNYGDNKYHPQPHWHFYPDQKIIEDFEEEQRVDFDFLKEELQKEIDIKRVHFAMNGQWAETGNHIHRINNQETIIKWFPGILSHIKYQLKETKKIAR